MEIDHHVTTTCTRSTKIFSNTPLIFQIDLELSELPRNYDILPDTRTDTNRDSTLHSSAQKTGSSELWRIRRE